MEFAIKQCPMCPLPFTYPVKNVSTEKVKRKKFKKKGILPFDVIRNNDQSLLFYFPQMIEGTEKE